MYRSGQVLWDDTFCEPVIFIEGNGKELNVVSNQAEEVTATEAKALHPIWKKDGSMLLGKFAMQNFWQIFNYRLDDWAKIALYLDEVRKKVPLAGKDPNYQYYVEG